METILSIPPLIKQYFSDALLRTPCPKLRDSCDTFERMWKEILKLWYKLEAIPQRKTRCEALKEEILELYERAKVKEKEREGQKNHKTQEFGYHVAYPKGLAHDVLARLVFGRKSGSFKHQFRRNREISKIQKGR